MPRASFQGRAQRGRSYTFARRASLRPPDAAQLHAHPPARPRGGKSTVDRDVVASIPIEVTDVSSAIRPPESAPSTPGCSLCFSPRPTEEAVEILGAFWNQGGRSLV